VWESRTPPDLIYEEGVAVICGPFFVSAKKDFSKHGKSHGKKGSDGESK
jgi:hypothetical protein